MVARDPADTPTEQFVPDFDDDVSDDEPDSLREPATPAGDAQSRDDPEDDAPAASAEPGPERSEHEETSDAPVTQVPRDADPNESDQPPDPPLTGNDLSGQSVASNQSVGQSQAPNKVRKKLPDPKPSPGRAGLTARFASPGSIRPAGPGQNGVVGGAATAVSGSLRVPGTVGRSTGSAGGTASARGAARTGGASPVRTGLARAYRLIGWERATVVGVLVLCTTVAGVLTGFAVVRATSDWTVTWGGTEQVDGRRPAPEGSRSTTPPQFDRPRYPGSTISVSPTPSVSASVPGPTGSARPSRSPKPRATPTPGVQPSETPTSAEPSPSGTGDLGNG